MLYAYLQNQKPDRFKRLTRVSPETFGEMIDTINAAWRDFGRPPKLSWADQLLLALLYWREYGSLAHIAMTYQISEPTVSRTIRRVENTLIQSGSFPCRRKKPCKNPTPFGSLLLLTTFADARDRSDITETPVERPQPATYAVGTAAKTTKALQRQKEISQHQIAGVD